MNRYSYVYVFSIPTGRVKIGVSVNPSSRIKEISTGCPYVVKIEHAFKMSRMAAFSVERAAHFKLSKYLVSGEWFECHVDIAEGAILDALDDFILGSGIDADKEFGCLLVHGDNVESGNIDYDDLFKMKRGKYIDGNGLQVRIGTSTIQFYLILTIAGKKNEIYLGKHPRMSLAEARKLARLKKESMEVEYVSRGACGPRKKVLVPGKLKSMKTESYVPGAEICLSSAGL